MKPTATILLLIWTLLMVQPLFTYFGGRAAYGECAVTGPGDTGGLEEQPGNSACAPAACSGRQACPSSPEEQDDDDCDTDGCNPTLGCSSGNFYIHHHQQLAFPAPQARKQKLFVADDNRVSKSLSECWRPPEMSPGH